MLLPFLLKILQEQRLLALQGGQGVMGVHVWLWCYLHRGAFLPWITPPHPETSSFIPSYTQLELGEAMTGGPASEVGMGHLGLFPTPPNKTDMSPLNMLGEIILTSTFVPGNQCV